MDKEKFNDSISQGIALMAAENYPAAKEEFSKAVEMDARSIDAYTHLGNACVNLGQYDEALVAFKNALLLDTTSGETLYSIGSIYLLKDEKLKAVEYYNKAESAGFKKAELYQILADVFFESNDTPQALRNITRAIAADPFDGNLRIFKVRIYLAEGKLDEAIETLDEMQKILPDAFEAYDLRAQILCGQEKYEEALKICELGCSRFPDDINLALSKLKVLVQMDREDDALQLVSDMKNNGKYALVLREAVTQESLAYIKKRDVQSAIKVLKEANDSLGGDQDILYLLLTACGRSEDYEQIIKVSEQLMGMNSRSFYNGTARYYHAFALEKLGRTEDAKKEYRQLISLLRRFTIEEPSFYEGYIYRLLSHTKLGEYDKALELAEYIENLYPDRADSHAFRYYIFKEQGDMEKAEIEKNEAVKINPKFKL